MKKNIYILLIILAISILYYFAHEPLLYFIFPILFGAILLYFSNILSFVLRRREDYYED